MSITRNVFSYITLFSILGLSPGLLTAPANAQVTPVEGWSKVNDGTEGCTSGVCKISGGVSSGKNLFHKLEKLNTNNGTIEKVSIDNIDQTSIILANIDNDRSYISVPFEALGSKADITILSPGGINIQNGFSTNNINKLILSTSDQIGVGAGLFDLNNTTFAQTQNLTGLINYATLTDRIANGSLIELSDNLSMDSGLLIISENINIDSATVQTSNSLAIDGRLRVKNSSIQAQEVALNGLGAKGSEGVPNSVGVWIGNNSEIQTVGPLSITGSSANTVKNTTTNVEHARGIEIHSSDLKSDRGMITLNGTGGSGNQVKQSHGIKIWRESSIRGPRIKLTGIGGKATDVSAPNSPSLEMYNDYDQIYGNSYFNSGILIEKGSKIVSNPANVEYGSSIILDDPLNNN